MNFHTVTMEEERKYKYRVEKPLICFLFFWRTSGLAGKIPGYGNQTRI
jgi:hypothetical protein